MPLLRKISQLIEEVVRLSMEGLEGIGGEEEGKIWRIQNSF